MQQLGQTITNPISQVTRSSNWTVVGSVPVMSVVRVKIVYFARARECAGIAQEELELTQPVSAQEVLSRVMTIHPGLADIEQSLSLLVNGKWVSKETELKEGDRLALLPPVGGG